jgi:flagellar biosynthesis protein FliR
MLISQTSVIAATLIFVRVGALLTGLPFFGDSSVPLRARILLAGAITLFLLPVVPISWSEGISISIPGIATAVVLEICLGLTMGFISKMIIEGVIAAASMLGYQMGFGTANLFIPDAGQSMDGFTALHRMIVLLFFLSLNLHHVFISGLAKSFEILPAGGFNMNASIATQLITGSSNLISSAVQIAAPVLTALMFSVAALGLIARTVPQLNVFTLSFPIGFFLGLLIYSATMPFFPSLMGDVKVLLSDSVIEFLSM